MSVFVQDASIDEVFKLLHEKTGVPPDEARLIHAGKELVQKKGKNVSDYPSIVHGSTLFMVMRLKGGEPDVPGPFFTYLTYLGFAVTDKYCITRGCR